MKNFNIKSLIALSFAFAITSFAYAGNEDRTGQAGASELLINPWAQSSGWGGVNTSSAHGIEATFLNVAGLSFIEKTDIAFAHTQWLKGSDISINSLGIGVKAGESGAFAISIMSFDFGEIEITTVDVPEGGIGTFKPQYLNIGLSYAKEFSNSIHGGITARIISESIADVSAQGMSFDAGIQYVTGFNEDKDDLTFGIALKNVGSPMRFEGDGLSIRGTAPLTGSVIAFEQRSDKFELPSLINIGATYRWDAAEDHEIQFAGNFQSNSFTQDIIGGGVQYGFKDRFYIRGAYSFEKDISDDELRITALTGLSGGFSINLPIGNSGKTFGIDYSYRSSDPFDGTHSFGARFHL